jgi:ribosomal protein S18 acetylase RimI-like enzyme
LSATSQLPLLLADKHGEPFTVRLMESRDRGALHEMYLDFLPKRAAQGLPPETAYAQTRWLDHVLRSGRHLLVEVNGVLRGHLMLIPLQNITATELAIYLHQSIRGRGIGTAMNKFAVNLARVEGFRRVWLSVEVTNVAAIRSYQKAGFKRTAATMWAHEIEMEVVF